MSNGNGSSWDFRDNGILFLNGNIELPAAEEVCREVIRYNLEGRLSRIQLIINSTGGCCPAGFAIIDIMEWSRIPVYTAGIGMVGSMGLLVFMAGAKGHRAVTPRTSILSHRFSTSTAGNHSQLLASRKEADLMHERMVDLYLRHSALTSKEEIEAKLLRDVDTWLTPAEAVEYGIVDVIEPPRLRVA